MRSAEEAVAYLKALHSIVVYLGITDGNMEEGSFRCLTPSRVHPSKGAAEFGTRAELKNLNSSAMCRRPSNTKFPASRTCWRTGTR